MINHVGKMTVAAHRGDCYNFFENTMTAFRAAINEKADMIELDVHMTSDGHLVVMHDATVDRTTDGTGKISEKTLDEMLSLNAGNSVTPEKVPTFEEFMVFAKSANTMLNIEIKEYYSEQNAARAAECIDKVIEAVERFEMADKILINSFDAWVLEYVYKKYGKKYMLHGFYPYTIMKNVSMNPDEYLYCACIFKDKPEFYEYLGKRGIEVWIGASVTQLPNLESAINRGAKLITTNNPTDTLMKLKKLGAR